MFTFRGARTAGEVHDRTRLLDNSGVTKVALIGGGNQSARCSSKGLKSVQQVGTGEVVYENVAVPPDSDFLPEYRRSGLRANGIVTGMDLLQNTALSDSLSKAGDVKATIFPANYDRVSSDSRH
jgi:hypothetical protein